MISLGYYKSNNLQQALKYINNAIVQNDTNVNYLSLKAKILADSNKPKQALKVLGIVSKKVSQQRLEGFNGYNIKLLDIDPINNYTEPHILP